MNLTNKRSIKELLELLLIKYRKHNSFGLCLAISNLQYLLSVDERYKLRKYLSDNQPKRNIYFDCRNKLINDRTQFWYPIGYVSPRIKWLNKHIKLNN